MCGSGYTMKKNWIRVGRKPFFFLEDSDLLGNILNKTKLIKNGLFFEDLALF